MMGLRKVINLKLGLLLKKKKKEVIAFTIKQVSL